MTIDFDKFGMIKKLAEKKTILYSVFKLNFDIDELNNGGNMIDVIGVFPTESEGQKAIEWLDKNQNLEKGIYTLRPSPVKEWKGD